MSEPAKTPDLEAMIRRVMREEIDRLEARLRGRRVDGKRRLRAPEASAARGSSDAHAVRCFNHHARQPDQRRGGVRIFRAVMGVDLEAVRHG